MVEKVWDAIVITCSDQDTAIAFENEFSFRQKNGFIDAETPIICVVDPETNIGSGGATINAIVYVTEYISALEGYTVISSDVLKDKRLLILHMGTSTPYSACSPGFLSLPATMMKLNGNGSCHATIAATQFDILLHMTINKLAENSPSGVWICSCDRLIKVPSDIGVDWKSGQHGIYLFTVPVDMNVAAHQHGVVKLGENNEVNDIIYKGDIDKVSLCDIGDGNVPVMSGVVFIKTDVIDSLLSISVSQPLVAYTYLGVDSGSAPNKSRPMASEIKDVYRMNGTNTLLSLYFDILLCMASNITMEDYVQGQRSGVYGTVHFPDLDSVDSGLRKGCRRTLWDTLRGISMKGEMLKDSEFFYFSHDPTNMLRILWNYVRMEDMLESDVTIKFSKNVTSLLSRDGNASNNIISINSRTPNVHSADNTVFLNCLIKNHLKVGANCLLSNLSTGDFQPSCNLDDEIVSLPDEMVVESLFLRLEPSGLPSVKKTLLMFGVKDQLQKSIIMPDSTIFNKPWAEFFARTNILPEELWTPDIPENKRCLVNAKMFPTYFPKKTRNLSLLLWMQGSFDARHMLGLWRSSWRLSIMEILDLCDAGEEFLWRKCLHFEIGKEEVECSLHARTSIHFSSFFKTCINNGYFESILEVLDNVALSSNNTSVIGRAFACIADVLGLKANGKGGLRSGPAANYLWKEGKLFLQVNKVKEAVKFMAHERKMWYSRPDLLVRAARHYEGAFQLQVRKAVATAREFIKLTQDVLVPMETWVTAEAPGRLDFAGGWSDTPPISFEQARVDIAGTWSDTPPICFENGGAVVMLTAVIDGKKPIGCRVKRMKDPKIVLVLGRENPVVIDCLHINDLLNYGSPNSPGALLKAAIFCAEILPREENFLKESLEDYLLRKYGGGFLLQTWSNLPQGSGLGTSSILAGCIISALWTITGMKHEVSSVLHAVLDLEQMLTTGGGWQDQVGGLCPGVKFARSESQLPLQIKVQPIDVPEGFLEKLEKHLLVVFTGKTRLARNMLQDVLRNWNSRSPEIVQTANDLISNVTETIEAFNQGDLVKLGHCLNWCWINKKKMAHGCEPEICRIIMDEVKDYVYGVSLAGAGGGGFMFMVTKCENYSEVIKERISSIPEARKATVHKVSIDKEGLSVKIGNICTE